MIASPITSVEPSRLAGSSWPSRSAAIFRRLADALDGRQWRAATGALADLRRLGWSLVPIGTGRGGIDR